MTNQSNEDKDGSAGGEAGSDKASTKRREIPGNLTYTSSPGVLGDILKAMRAAERPDRFSGDFLSTVLNFSGGSARAAPPVLKRMGFLTSDGTPTDLYGKFRTDGGKSHAAYEALKNAYAEMFRRNTYAHKLDEAKLKDLVAEITGLTKSDGVLRSIVTTFTTIRDFIELESLKVDEESPEESNPLDEPGGTDAEKNDSHASGKIGLAYNINIVLPETTNVSVFNAIFKSLKENLL